MPETSLEKLKEIYPGLNTLREIKNPATGKLEKVRNVAFILPPKTPSDWDRFADDFKKYHEEAIKNPLTRPVPYTIDTNGNFIHYVDIKDQINEQTKIFNAIKKTNSGLFNLIDDNYKIAKSDESLQFYDFVTPLDVATIVGPVALKGLKFTKVLVTTEKGARLSLVADTFKGFSPLGKLGKTAEVTELIEASNSLRITNDLVKSGLIRCASPCTLQDIKILLINAKVSNSDIQRVESYIKTDNGLDRLRLRNLLRRQENIDLIKQSIDNTNNIFELKSISAVIEDVKETGLNKDVLDKFDNLVKEISIKENKIKQDLTFTIDYTYSKDGQILKSGEKYNVEKTYVIGDKGTLSFVKLDEDYYKLYTTNKFGVSGALEIPDTGNIDEFIEYIKLNTKLDVEKTTFPNKVRIKNIKDGKDLIITIKPQQKIRAIEGYLKYGGITKKDEVTSLY